MYCYCSLSLVSQDNTHANSRLPHILINMKAMYHCGWHRKYILLHTTTLVYDHAFYLSNFCTYLIQSSQWASSEVGQRSKILITPYIASRLSNVKSLDALYGFIQLPWLHGILLGCNKINCVLYGAKVWWENRRIKHAKKFDEKIWWVLFVCIKN